MSPSIFWYVPPCYTRAESMDLMKCHINDTVYTFMEMLETLIGAVACGIGLVALQASRVNELWVCFPDFEGGAPVNSNCIYNQYSVVAFGLCCMNADVFVYGSLMYAPVWESVVLGKYDSVEALLPGFRRAALEGQTYPGAVRQDGHSIVGRLYLNVDGSDLKRLDDFEGEWYERISVTVKTTDADVPAQVYYWLHDDLTIETDWSVQEFESTGLDLFLSTYVQSRREEGKAR